MRLITKSWKKYLSEELEKPYMKDIEEFLLSEKKNWKIIYPQSDDILNALNYCDFDDVKVVILWQDPYHGEWQAHWMSFSVQDWVRVPPSLKNIYKEIEGELRIEKNKENWNLEWRAKQWVLLLNSVLTVEAWKPASHSKIWWQQFTDTIIRTISQEKRWVVFLLWWAFSIWKQELLDGKKHLILTSPHPSPLSVYKWFYGNMHFKKCNEYLEKNNKSIIRW